MKLYITGAFLGLLGLLATGFTGLLTMLGVFVFYLVPVYFLLKWLCISSRERLVLTPMLSLGLLAIPVYWLGKIWSFRGALLVVFVCMIIGFVLLKKYVPVPVHAEEQ